MVSFSDSDFLNKWYKPLLHLGFLPLFLGAIYYFMERLTGCAGQDIFRVLNSGEFFLIHGRLTHFFSQWLPLLALKGGLSIKSIALIFSVSPVLHHYLLFVFVLHVLKDPITAFAILFVQYFGISVAFFANPNLEIQYCISLGLVFYSLYNNSSLPVNLRWFIGGVVIVMIANSYLPTVVFLPFSVLISERKMAAKDLSVFTSILVLALAYKFIDLDTYVEGVLNFELVQTTPLDHIQGLLFFIGKYLSSRLVELIVGVAVTLYLIFSRSWKLLLLFGLANLFYMSLIVKFYGLNVQSEHIGLPLTFFVAAIVIALLKESLKIRRVSFYALIVFIGLKSFIILGIVGGQYQTRTDELLTFISKLECLPSNRLVLRDIEDELSFTSHSLSEYVLIYSKIIRSSVHPIVLVEDQISSQLSSLGIQVNEQRLDSVSKKSDQALLRWLDSKFDDFDIDSSVFDVRDQGFIMISEDMLCDLSN